MILQINTNKVNDHSKKKCKISKKKNIVDEHFQKKCEISKNIFIPISQFMHLRHYSEINFRTSNIKNKIK